MLNCIERWVTFSATNVMSLLMLLLCLRIVVDDVPCRLVSFTTSCSSRVNVTFTILAVSVPIKLVDAGGAKELV